MAAPWAHGQRGEARRWLEPTWPRIRYTMGGVVAGTAMLVGWWDATLSVVQPIRARGWWRPTENKARPFNYDTQMWTPTITPVHVVPTEPIDTTDYLVSSTGDEILTDTTETTKLEAS